MREIAEPDGAGRKVRVLKAPAVRRAELLDCAQRLFLTRGYEQTTVNDVIAATGLSKGAFYHHFRAKEDLLEAIAGRFAHDALGFIQALQSDAGLDALPGEVEDGVAEEGLLFGELGERGMSRRHGGHLS